MIGTFPSCPAGLQAVKFYKSNAVGETELKTCIKTRHWLYVLRSWYGPLLRCSSFPVVHLLLICWSKYTGTVQGFQKGDSIVWPRFAQPKCHLIPPKSFCLMFPTGYMPPEAQSQPIRTNRHGAYCGIIWD